jgi:bacterial/archaeal transporter family-2 protein
MWIPIGLAFINGIIIAVNRVFNGRLAKSKGALQASFWNHLVGFAFLIPICLLLGSFAFITSAGTLPPFVYAGGALGALFVALSSWVIVRTGAINGIILVIAGQMIMGTFIDSILGRIHSITVALIGVALILIGVKLSQLGLRRSNADANSK